MPTTDVPPTRIIDSHTGGEPTRLVVEGGPDLGRGTMAERRARFLAEHDHWRRALATEPRGHDVIVGGIVTPPANPGSHCGIVFFNNVGVIGMCGHGTIGLVATLAWLGRVQPGRLAIDTPVGTVQAELHADGGVTVANVPSYRHRRHLAVDVPGHGRVHGDVAWGGNWFFLCHDHGVPIDRAHLPQLLALSERVRQALVAAGITGEGGAEIDHVELLGPAAATGPGAGAEPGAGPAADVATRAGAHASPRARKAGRSFVLCPGLAYDRSPCGTGTSAKLACLAADGELAPGEVWHQESVIGSVFTARYERAPRAEGGGNAGRDEILPFIHGRAHVTLDARVIIDPNDPFAWGLG